MSDTSDTVSLVDHPLLNIKAIVISPLCDFIYLLVYLVVFIDIANLSVVLRV